MEPFSPMHLFLLIAVLLFLTRDRGCIGGILARPSWKKNVRKLASQAAWH